MRPTDGGGPANNSWHINDSAPLWSPPHHRKRAGFLPLEDMDRYSRQICWGCYNYVLQAILEQDFHSRVRTGRGR